MAPKLYLNVMSPPCRAVLLVAKAIDLELDRQEVDKEYMKTPEMLQINPQHTMPTLVEEDGFVLWDSHAIAGYLVATYAPDDSLYPKEDVKLRATIDQRLHFDNGVLFTGLVSILRPVFCGATEIPEECREHIFEAYGFMEAFLKENKWLAGDDMTIADLCALATITTLELLVPIEESEYPQLYDWLKRGKELPYFEETNREGLDTIEAYFKSKLQQ